MSPLAAASGLPLSSDSSSASSSPLALISSASVFMSPERFEGLTLRSGPSSATRRLDRPPRVLGAALGDLADRLPRGRVDRLERPPGGGLGPLAADHQAVRPARELAGGVGERLGGGRCHRSECYGYGPGGRGVSRPGTRPTRAPGPRRRAPARRRR